MQTAFTPHYPSNTREARLPTAQPAAGSTAADARGEQSSTETWMNAQQPVETFMALNADCIAPGWRKTAVRTLVKLLAVADGSATRRKTIEDLRVCSTSTGLYFSASTMVGRKDAVVLGICRKARDRSCTVCRDCGRPARVRLIGEDQSVTQCARCVAPALLKHDIWELEQSLRFLMAVGRTISANQIPALLRPSFLEISTRKPMIVDGQVRPYQMRVDVFQNWAEGWRQIGKGLAVVH